MDEASNPHKRVDAEKCPTCRSAHIVDDPDQAGEIYRCGNCGARLTRLKREGLFGEQYYYVDPGRRGLKVHTAGRNEAP